MYNRAVIITAKDVQDEEFLYPYYRLQEAGFFLDVCLVGEIAKGKYGIPIRPVPGSQLLSPSNLTGDYDVIIIPGGWAPELVRMNKDVLKFVKRSYEAGAIIGAICHGPQVLISAMICENQTITGYIGIADDIANAGAIYVDRPVVVSNNIVTSPHYRDNPIWMKTVLEEHEKRVLAQYVVH